MAQATDSEGARHWTDELLSLAASGGVGWGEPGSAAAPVQAYEALEDEKRAARAYACRHTELRHRVKVTKSVIPLANLRNLESLLGELGIENEQAT